MAGSACVTHNISVSVMSPCTAHTVSETAKQNFNRHFKSSSIIIIVIAIVIIILALYEDEDRM